MKQKSKLVSLLLTLCMALTLLPAAAFAQETIAGDSPAKAQGVAPAALSADGVATQANVSGPTTLYVNGVDMLNGGTVTGVSYDADTATLTLNGANLNTLHKDTAAYTAGVIFVEGGSLTIEVKGSSKITYADLNDTKIWHTCGIYFNNVDLTITGGGELTIQNAAASGGKTTNYYDLFGGSNNSSDPSKNSSLTIDGVTVKCDADNAGAAVSQNVRGILLWGTLVVDNSTLLINLRNTTSSDAIGLHLSGSNLTHRLTGNTTVTMATGSGNDAVGIEFSATIQIGAGAALRTSGAKEAISKYSSGSISSADNAELTAKGSATYNDSNLTDISVTNNEIVAKDVSSYKTLEVTAASSAPAAPVFTDGFGNTITNANTYKAGTTTNDKGYTFAGWFDENGTELTDITTAAPGATYTAKWTKDDKTVRTTKLDFTNDTAWQSGCTQNGTLWTNESEGWSWNAEMNTLTLNGVTIDVSDASKATSAITLPAGALIITAGTNTVVAGSGIDAITGIDNLTISGTGSLYVEGDSGIFVSRANASTGLTINAPLTAKSNSNRKDDVDAAIWVDSGGSLTIGSSLKIQTPTNGKVITRDSKTLIVDAGNKAAMEVVIASAGSVVEPTITDLKLTPATASVEKGKTQQFKATMTITPARVTPTLTWSVTGNKSSATKIDQTGLLTVGADETATTLTVTVSASVDGGEAVGATATVTVTSPSTSPKYYYKNTGTTSSNTPGKSPKTADAGIALYAGMAVASLLGSGVVLNRKRKNF